MDKFRPPFRVRWNDLLLLFFLVLEVIFITFIIIIVVVIPCSIRVPFLLSLALAPARLAPLASPSSVGACAPLGIEYSSVKA